MEKRTLSERDICIKATILALRTAEWNEMLQVREDAIL